MYTRWRLYILALFSVLFLALLFGVRFLRDHGVPISRMQAFLFLLGAMLAAETLVVSTLSNFNLGVILPAFFGLPLVVAAFLLPHMDGGFLLVLKRVMQVCYALAGVIFLVCGILMLSAQHDAEDVRADAVIVLGAAVHGDKVTWVLENRLNTAAKFMAANPNAVCVVSGGQGSGESVTEGSAMKKYMVANGTDESRILAEERATDTMENFRYSKAILDDLLGEGYTTAFVTTDFHVYRAGRAARAMGLDAKGISAPDVWYLRLNNFMRESVGIAVYALRGNFK